MRALSAALLVMALCAAPAAAQKAHEYDTQAEVTITGVVVDYHESKARNDHPGLHFILKIASAPADAPSETASPSLQPETPAPSLEPETPATEPVEAPAEPAVAPEAETVEVHACPVKLLSQLDFPIEKGDELTVTGSRSGDGTVLIAREIKKGTVSLQLRDEKGVPIWTGLR